MKVSETEGWLPVADPARLTFRPLEDWADPKTDPAARRSSTRFRAHYDDTLDLLAYEAGQVGAREVVVQLAIGEGDLRVDGTPKVRAAPHHPGVVVSFDSTHGPLRYATDAYHGWRANLRAIALALQALRAVDRYGITRSGEQYRGWRQIEPPRTNGAMTQEQAARFLAEQAGYQPGRIAWDAVLAGRTGARREAYRLAAKRLHPDAGGDAGLFDQLAKAYEALGGGP